MTDKTETLLTKEDEEKALFSNLHLAQQSESLANSLKDIDIRDTAFQCLIPTGEVLSNKNNQIH